MTAFDDNGVSHDVMVEPKSKYYGITSCGLEFAWKRDVDARTVIQPTMVPSHESTDCIRCIGTSEALMNWRTRWRT